MRKEETIENNMQVVRLHDLPSAFPRDMEFNYVKQEWDGNTLILSGALDSGMFKYGVNSAISVLNTLEERIKIRDELLAEGVAKVNMEYDGYGDSGQTNYISHDQAQYFLDSLISHYHSGFENNEGGGGEIAWDLIKDEISIEHYDNYEMEDPDAPDYEDDPEAYEEYYNNNDAPVRKEYTHHTL